MSPLLTSLLLVDPEPVCVGPGMEQSGIRPVDQGLLFGGCQPFPGEKGGQKIGWVVVNHLFRQSLVLVLLSVKRVGLLSEKCMGAEPMDDAGFYRVRGWVVGRIVQGSLGPDLQVLQNPHSSCVVSGGGVQGTCRAWGCHTSTTWEDLHHTKHTFPPDLLGIVA